MRPWNTVCPAAPSIIIYSKLMSFHAVPNPHVTVSNFSSSSLMPQHNAQGLSLVVLRYGHPRCCFFQKANRLWSVRRFISLSENRLATLRLPT